MKNDAPDIVFVPASVAFPGERNDFEEFLDLLRELSLTDTLCWCSRLIQIIASPLIKDEKAKQEYGLRFFYKEQLERINSFTSKNGGANEVRIFFRGQLLELLRWSLLISRDREGDGETFNDPNVKQLFARAALIASQLWSQRVYENISGYEEMNLKHIRKAMDSVIHAVDEQKAYGRSNLLILKHLRKHYPTLLEDFQELTGLTLHEYYYCLTAIMANYLPREIPEPLGDPKPVIFHEDQFWTTAPHKKEILVKFLALESQTAQRLRYELWYGRNEAAPENAGPFDYRPLRTKPILRSYDGRHIITDPNFITDKLSVGPLFHLSAAIRQKQEGRDKRGLFPAFGKAFEDYSIEILTKMFGGESSVLVKRFSGPFLRERQGREREDKEICDGCLNDVTDLALFEIKARWIADDTLEAETEAEYESDLLSKFGEGARQLALAIDKLQSNAWTPIDQNIDEVKKVFPLLIVYDRLLDTHGHAKFLSTEFASKLAPDSMTDSGWMVKGRWLVAPLTVITIEVLEILESSVRGFSLIQLLSDYASQHQDRDVSLLAYLGASKYSKMIRSSALLAEAGIKLLEETEAMFFPSESDEMQIAIRAYEIWEMGGYTHGNDVNDWLQAESELKAK